MITFRPELETQDPIENCTPARLKYYFNPKAEHASLVKGLFRISHEKDWHLVLANVNYHIAKNLCSKEDSALKGITTIFNQILSPLNLYVKSIEHKGFQYHISTKDVLRIAPNSGTYMFIHVKPKEIEADFFTFFKNLKECKENTCSVAAQQKITFKADKEFAPGADHPDRRRERCCLHGCPWPPRR